MAATVTRNTAAGYNSIDAFIRSGYTRPCVSQGRLQGVGGGSPGRFGSYARTRGMKS